MHKGNVFFAVISAAAFVQAGPLHFRQDNKAPSASSSPVPEPSGDAKKDNSTLAFLGEGNKYYQENVLKEGNGVANITNNGTAPTYFIGCADSKTPGSALFNTQPGQLITQNNIGNLYSTEDRNADTALKFAITDKGIQHVFVMGHYGCSAVKSVLVNDTAFPMWLSPVSKVLKESNRWAIKQFRDQKDKKDLKDIKDDDRAFKALVEESTKWSVGRMKNNSLLAGNESKPYPFNANGTKGSDLLTTITNKILPLQVAAEQKNESAIKEVWVHGLVVNETSGEVFDLDVSWSSNKDSKDKPELPFPKARRHVAPAPQIVTQTVTVNAVPVTVTASIQSGQPEETVATTVKGEDVTVTVSATAEPVVVTQVVQVENKPVTVTVSADPTESTVLTTVKGQDVTISVTASADPTNDAHVEQPQTTIETTSPAPSAPSSSASASSASSIVSEQPSSSVELQQQHALPTDSVPRR